MKIKLMIFGIFGLLLLNLVIAGFEVGTIEIENIYGPGGDIRGWIDLTLNETPGGTLLTGFNTSITLKEFLYNNDADYSCVPEDCEKAYSTVGVSNSTQEFSIDFGESKLIGVRLTGEVGAISDLSFDVSSNAGKSCVYPLEIDVLDDGVVDWIVDKGSNDFSCTMYKPFGCFEESDVNESATKYFITDSEYCEMIEIPVAGNYKIGAEVIKAHSGSEEISFIMSIYTGAVSDSCDAFASESGEVSCVVELDLDEVTQADVCISVYEEDKRKYKIEYETVEPCGYTDTGEADFPIFIRAGKYSEVTDFEFNISMAEEIEDYIFSRYNDDCEPECIIPIKFKAGTNQDVVVSNLGLSYLTIGEILENDIYELEEEDILMDLDLERLSLDKGYFKVPLSYGKKYFKLKLGDEEILNEEIEVSRVVPNIKSVVPSKVASLVSNTFIVVVDSVNSSGFSYTWDFGDGLSDETSINRVKHVYDEIGVYELVVSVESEFGTSTKSIEVNVVSPKNKIPSVIEDYNKNLDGIKSVLGGVPTWIRTEIEKEIDVTSLKADIGIQSARYDLASSDEAYIEIMTNLIDLGGPESLKIVNSINSFPVFMDLGQLDVDVLDGLGLDSDVDEEQYTSIVNGWMMSNLEVFLDSKKYSFVYDYGDELIATSLMISLTPKKDLENVYFIISEDIGNIKFAGNYAEEDVAGSTVITFDNLIGTETIEFLYPDIVEIGNFPVYITSDDEEIISNIITGIKCGDGVCDENENIENCREDCKPLGMAILFLVFLFFGGFAVYVILQEWYKKYYESRLFQNRNQLFNLINFMNNSINQGIKKKNIFKKLKEAGWKREQVSYAWKKLNGKRIGMWEIPVFKWVENKKVKKEIAKRKGMPVGKIRPRPV